jgi:broad specificity phosphatase PhoE
MPGMSVSIVYETHSISTDNEAGIATGWLPGKLSAAGRAAAAELGQRRRSDNIDAIYVSDLGRALETVRIAFDGSAIPVVVDARLRECNYGLLNGAASTVVAQQRAQHIEMPWPEGESYVDVVSRTKDFLDDLMHNRDGQRVLVVAHSANRWALQHLLEGRDLRTLVTADFAWQPGWEFKVG